MEPSTSGVGYRIWGADQVVYGPVELPVLVSWIKDERVLADTWIFSDDQQSWQKAAALSETQMFFRAKAQSVGGEPPAGSATGEPVARMRVGPLRRIKLLADFSDPHLERFAGYLEKLEVRQNTELVKQGQPGDSMYFILEGELRVRLMIAGKESVLMTLAAGEFFGEMALFDDGPRSADVIANVNCVLLRLVSTELARLRGEEPVIAGQLLFALGKSMTARIRADNKRFRDSVNFARSAGVGQ